MRIAVADDGGLFRDGLVLLLGAAGHQVVGAVGDGDALTDLACIERPDVVLLDIRMPPGDEGGLSTARRIRDLLPATGIVMLSHHAESHYLMRALEVGTERIGYRLKERISGVGPLSDTLTRVVSGDIVIEPEIAALLVNRAARCRGRLDLLHERERDVLRLMAEGQSNSSIAAALFVSVKAVEKRTASIFIKLGLPDDASAYHRRVLAVLVYLREHANA